MPRRRPCSAPPPTTTSSRAGACPTRTVSASRPRAGGRSSTARSATARPTKSRSRSPTDGSRRSSAESTGLSPDREGSGLAIRHRTTRALDHPHVLWQDRRSFGQFLEATRSFLASRARRSTDRLPRLHSYRAVEADRFPVEHDVLDDVGGEGAVLGGTAQAWREGHLLAERDAGRLRQSREQGSVEEPRRDGAYANAELRQISGDRQRHADDAALGGRVGGLAYLSVEGRDGGGVDHDAAFAFLVGLIPGHVRGGEPDAVEGADQVDLDHSREDREIGGAALAVGLLGCADARAVDQHVD